MATTAMPSWTFFLIFLCSLAPDAAAAQAGSGEPGQVFVQDARALSEALKTEGVTRIVALQDIDFYKFIAMPLPIDVAHNVTITGPGRPALVGPQPINTTGSITLNFASLYPVLHILPGVQLELANLQTEGVVPKYGNESIRAAASLIRPIGFELWPAILPEPDSSVLLNNVLWHTYTGTDCSEGTLKQISLSTSQVFGGQDISGYNTATNTTYLLGLHPMPILVRAPNETTLGSMQLITNGTSWGCMEDPLKDKYAYGGALSALNPPAAAEEDSGLSAGAIAGIAVGATALVAACSAGIWLATHKKSRTKESFKSSDGPSKESLLVPLPSSAVLEIINRSHQDMAVASALRVRFGNLEGLEIGHLIGRGAHGRIYKGSMRGAPVAVKVVEHSVSPGMGLAAQGVTTEAVMLTALAHPHIVRVHRVATIKLMGSSGGGSINELSGGSLGEEEVQRSGCISGKGLSVCERARSPTSCGDLEQGTLSESGRDTPQSPMQRDKNNSSPSAFGISGPGIYETWLILEFCESGSLHDAIRRKKYFYRNGAPMLLPMLRVLCDVAEGMEFLHSGASILHGDLKPANVLLKAGTTAGTVMAVVADFGLSRMLDVDSAQNSVQRTSTAGTVQYMSPELLATGRLSRAADVWSFGMCMLELWSGETAFGDLTAAQVYFALVQRGEAPRAPEGCPPRYAALAEGCLRMEPSERLTFDEILTELRSMVEELLHE